MRNFFNSCAIIVLLGLALMSCGSDDPQARDSASLSNTDKRSRIEAMATEYRKEYPDVEELTVPDLMARRTSEHVLLVDARDEAEQAVSMISGAITSAAFEKNKSFYKEHLIVTYCTIGYRSGLYAQALQEEGYNARNLRGSILAWAHAGHPLVDAQGLETKRVHVYGKQWNLLPDGYVPVW